MQVIKKCQRDKPSIVIRHLNTAEVDALYWVFVKNSGKEAQRRQVTILAEYIRDHEGWLQCNCLPQEGSALMTIGLSQRNNYYLQHINARGRHHPDCRFKEHPTQNIATSAGQHQYKDNAILHLHQRSTINTSSDHKPSNNPSSSASQRTSGLSRFLYSLIEKQHLNHLPLPDSSNIAEQYHKLKSATSSYLFAKGVPAQPFVFTYPNLPQIAEKLKASLSQWKGNRAYAVCIAVADNIDDKTLVFTFKDKTITVTLEGLLKQSSGRLGKKSKPYLAAFTITDTEDKQGYFRPLNGFYVPVFSKYALIPVDSDFERQVLKTIKQWSRWWIQDKQLQVEVIKPIFDIPVDIAGEVHYCKPDFLIVTPNQRIVFEVMGSHEESYIERKKRTTSIMAKLGKIIEFDALQAEIENCWQSHLDQKIRQLSACVFKGQ